MISLLNMEMEKMDSLLEKDLMQFEEIEILWIHLDGQFGSLVIERVTD